MKRTYLIPLLALLLAIPSIGQAQCTWKPILKYGGQPWVLDSCVQTHHVNSIDVIVGINSTSTFTFDWTINGKSVQSNDHGSNSNHFITNPADGKYEYVVKIRDTGAKCDTTLKRTVNHNCSAVSVSDKPYQPLTLSPNPASGIVTLSGISVTADIELVNALGQKMEVSRTGNTLDVSELIEGIYMITVLDEGVIRRGRLVVNH